MTDEEIEQVVDYMSGDICRICPIILLSNKEGMNVQSLKQIIMKLQPRFQINTSTNEDQVFNVTSRYRVNGVGTVVSGRVIKGTLRAGDRLFVGPIRGECIPVLVKSLHNNFREIVEKLVTGQSGCIAIKSTKKKVKLANLKFKKGVIVANYQTTYRTFIAKIAISKNNYTTMKVGYHPVINCKSIVQVAAITEIIESSNEDVIRGGEQALVRFSFVFHDEHISVGDRFFFREGQTKGVGIIQELM